MGVEVRMDMVVVAHPGMVGVGLREGGEVAAEEVAEEGVGERVGKVMAKGQRTGTTNSYSSNDLIPLSVLFFPANPKPKPKPKPRPKSDPPPLLPPTFPLLVAVAATVKTAATAKAVGKDRSHGSTMIHPSSSFNDPNKNPQHKALKSSTYEHEHEHSQIPSGKHHLSLMCIG